MKYTKYGICLDFSIKCYFLKKKNVRRFYFLMFKKNKNCKFNGKE